MMDRMDPTRWARLRRVERRHSLPNVSSSWSSHRDGGRKQAARACGGDVRRKASFQRLDAPRPHLFLNRRLRPCSTSSHTAASPSQHASVSLGGSHGGRGRKDAPASTMATTSTRQAPPGIESCRRAPRSVAMELESSCHRPRRGRRPGRQMGMWLGVTSAHLMTRDVGMHDAAAVGANASCGGRRPGGSGRLARAAPPHSCSRHAFVLRSVARAHAGVPRDALSWRSTASASCGGRGSDGDVCILDGITCKRGSSRRVNVINLQDKGLTGSLPVPTSLSSLTALKDGIN